MQISISIYLPVSFAISSPLSKIVLKFLYLLYYFLSNSIYSIILFEKNQASRPLFNVRSSKVVGNIHIVIRKS